MPWSKPTGPRMIWRLHLPLQTWSPCFFCFCLLSDSSSVSLTCCYGLNACVLSRFICWASNPQCGCVWRWGLWAVTGFGWGHGGGAPRMELVPFINGWRDQSTLSAKKALCKPGRGSSLEPNHTGTLIWDLQPLEQQDINVWCLNHPVYSFCYSSPSRLRHPANSSKVSVSHPISLPALLISFSALITLRNFLVDVFLYSLIGSVTM